MHRSSSDHGTGRWRRLIASGLLVLIAIAPAAAQSEDAPPPATAGGEPSPERVEQSPLTTFVFRDENGALVEMPNFSFADFEKAYKLLQGLAQQDPRPRYSIQWFSLAGEAVGNHAELELTARVLVRDPNWVQIPLRLDQAMVEEPLQAPEAVQAFLHPESGGEGYVCYFRGEPGQQHTLKLKLLAPLDNAGERTRLALRLPRATASELKLKVPLPELEAEASEDATLLPPASADGATLLTVLGAGGDFRLTWGKPEVSAGSVPVVLQADGTIAARMDGPTVSWTATLSVRSFGAPFDRFRVRLPVGSQLVPDSPTGYSVTAIQPSEEETRLGPLVEVRLDKKSAGPVEVRLAARRVIEDEQSGDWGDLAGFAVVGAVRQSGHLAVAVPNDWQVLWGPQRGVRRIDQLPAPLRNDDVVAGFEYSTQPALLQARLVPKTTRLSVRPEYLILAGENKVDLRAQLGYSIRGAKVYALTVKLPGWELDAVEPENLVALDGVTVGDDGDLHIPLLQPTRGDLQITVLAHRPIPISDSDSGGKSVPIQWPLPQPHADTSGPALVVVVPDDNIEVVTDPAKTVGLVRQRTVPAMELPVRQQVPICLRAEAPDAVFAANIRRLAQRIEVRAVSQVAVHPSTAQVEQRFEYTILHKPADRFLLAVPQTLITGEEFGFKVQHDGEAIPVRIYDGEGKEPLDNGVIVQADLQQPCIGRCELAVSYTAPLPPAPAKGRVAASVPLIMPYAASLEDNRVLLPASQELVAEVAGDTWRQSALSNTAKQPVSDGKAYVVSGPSAAIELELGAPLALRRGTTVVERAWVQTWLIQTDRSDRQDRAVFCVRSDASQLDVYLPEGTAMEQVFVWLNSARVENFSVDGNRLLVPLGDDEVERTYDLELGYHFPEPVSRHGVVAVELPHLGEQVWVRRMYWQLVLPRHEHLVVAPEGFTSESPWRWAGYLFARDPLLEQPELEIWSGAERRTPVSRDTNRYLFSATGYPRQAVLRTANRAWIVLGASGLALVAGLVLIYVPAGRHPGTLFVAAVVLACVGLLYPAPTLLVAQAASLGLGLTLLAGLLERSVARRRATPLAWGGGSSVESDSTLTQHEAVRAGDPTTTQAVALGIGSGSPQDCFP